MPSFSSFNFLPTLAKALIERELTSPTEIQMRVIPLMIDMKSLVGVAETGSGKTLAFALPLLHLAKKWELAGDPVTQEGKPRAVVVVPTRELGEQVTKAFKPYTHTTRVRVRAALGGTTLEMARRSVGGGFEILVATPGRLVKLLEMRLVSLKDVRVLVFDEADQMLDHGFLPDAQRIVKACPADRQLALFSATVSPAVTQLIEELFSEAEIIRSEGSHRVVSTLTTKRVSVPDGKRFPLLEQVLHKKVEGGTIIFVNTREQCDQLAEELENADWPCLIYRGEMDKVERRANLKAFRDGEIDLLVSTDLASRGLDVERVGRVINYHMPQQMENYLHRVGRTARAGREGLVVNFITPRDEEFATRIEKVQPAPKRKF